MNKNILIILIARALRVFGFGAVTVIFIQFLLAKNLEEYEIGLLQSLIFIGDIIISLTFNLNAQKIGKKWVLVIGSTLKVIANLIYMFSNNFTLLAISGALGSISVSGSQNGPFIPTQIAYIFQICEQDEQREEDLSVYGSRIMGYYSFLTFVPNGIIFLLTGIILTSLTNIYGGSQKDYYDYIWYFYTFLCLVNFILYLFLDSHSGPANTQLQIREQGQEREQLNCIGVKNSSLLVIIAMAMILGIVAFANSFASIPFLSYYMQNKYSVEIHTVGLILGMGTLMSGIPPLFSSLLANRTGIMFGIIIIRIFIITILCLIAFLEIKTVILSLIILYLVLSGMTPGLTRTLESLMVSKEQRASATALVSASMLGFDSLGLLASGFLWGHQTTSFLFSLPFLLAASVGVFFCICIFVAYRNNPQINKFANGTREEEPLKEDDPVVDEHHEEH